jgi:hypothetical protein
VGHTHRGMRNAHNILREDTIKETLAQGMKFSLMAGFYEQNDRSLGSINVGTLKIEKFQVFKNT